MKTIRSSTIVLTLAAHLCGWAQLANGQTTQWDRIPTDPASTPTPRHNEAMVFDEKRGVILMQGGRTADGTIFSDTWQWDGQTWTLMSTEGPKVFDHNMVYDPSREVVVLYGGRVAPGHNDPTGDTWEWDGESWKLIEPGPVYPPEPAPPVLGGMAYDPIRQKVVRQGGVGLGDTFDVDETWEWTGQTWNEIAHGFIRGGHSILFDPVRQKMIAYGGSNTSNTELAPGTFEFDGTNWNLITNAGPPDRATFGRAFVWDVHRNVGVLYGGIRCVGCLGWSDTWEWDGEKWSQVIVPGPGPRAMHSMAYDSKRRKVVLFGGWRDCFRCSLNETWEYGLPPLRLSGPERQPDGSLEVRWTGEAPPYQLQSRTNLNAGDWQDEGAPTDQTSATVQPTGDARFFRVLSLFGNTP